MHAHTHTHARTHTYFHYGSYTSSRFKTFYLTIIITVINMVMIIIPNVPSEKEPPGQKGVKPFLPVGANHNRTIYIEYIVTVLYPNLNSKIPSVC